jgi:prolyl-tRNA editing enzyme YbaK/EbsC (Cys-tRNA(Pro) deacylase)
MLSHTSATAREAAAALDIPLFQIGKSIVFSASDKVLVVVLCGDQRVDIDQLVQTARVNSVSKLSAEQVKRRTGYAIGGVSPFGLPEGVQVIVDSRLHSLSSCYVSAGHERAVVLTDGKEIVALTEALVGAVALKV